jgi:hypothetical protein
MTAKIIEFPLVLKAPANCSIHELINALSESFEAWSPELQREFQRRARAAKTQ